MASDSTAAALRETLISPNVVDANWESANVVDVIDRAGRSISGALRSLGTNNAATNMGGLELLANEVKEGTERMARAIELLADTIARRVG